MLAGVESPHVAKVLGFGYEEEQPFLVLERLRGETLADLLKRDGRIPIDRLTNWIEQLLVGVRDCHAAGVIHRELAEMIHHDAHEEADQAVEQAMREPKPTSGDVERFTFAPSDVDAVYPNDYTGLPS